MTQPDPDAVLTGDTLPPRTWNPFGPDPEPGEVVMVGKNKLRFKHRIHDSYTFEAVEGSVVTRKFLDMMTLGPWVNAEDINHG